MSTNTYSLIVLGLSSLILLLQIGILLLQFRKQKENRRPPLHILAGVRVAQVMNDIPAVSPKDTLESVQEIMFAREVFALPVLDEDGELCGIVSMSDITKIERGERGNVQVSAVHSRDVKYTFPDQTVHEVVERMREFHLANFPVVSRRDEKQLLGMITKADIMLAYKKMALELSV
ncbi:MAG TPA: CBS domain-containing protein [Terriglobales bacterium]|nr:CBS domain-containing protein [Terriglobales bacterium]